MYELKFKVKFFFKDSQEMVCFCNVFRIVTPNRSHMMWDTRIPHDISQWICLSHMYIMWQIIVFYLTVTLWPSMCLLSYIIFLFSVAMVTLTSNSSFVALPLWSKSIALLNSFSLSFCQSSSIFLCSASSTSPGGSAINSFSESSPLLSVSTEIKTSHE